MPSDNMLPDLPEWEKFNAEQSTSGYRAQVAASASTLRDPYSLSRAKKIWLIVGWLLVLGLAPVGLYMGLMSGMMTDSCGPGPDSACDGDVISRGIEIAIGGPVLITVVGGVANMIRHSPWIPWIVLACNPATWFFGESSASSGVH